MSGIALLSSEQLAEQLKGYNCRQVQWIGHYINFLRGDCIDSAIQKVLVMAVYLFGKQGRTKEYPESELIAFASKLFSGKDSEVQVREGLNLLCLAQQCVCQEGIVSLTPQAMHSFGQQAYTLAGVIPTESYVEVAASEST